MLGGSSEFEGTDSDFIQIQAVVNKEVCLYSQIRGSSTCSELRNAREPMYLAAIQYNLQKQKDVVQRLNFFYKEEIKQNPLASGVEISEY